MKSKIITIDGVNLILHQEESTKSVVVSTQTLKYLHQMEDPLALIKDLVKNENIKPGMTGKLTPVMTTKTRTKKVYLRRDPRANWLTIDGWQVFVTKLPSANSHSLREWLAKNGSTIKATDFDNKPSNKELDVLYKLYNSHNKTETTSATNNAPIVDKVKPLNDLLAIWEKVDKSSLSEDKKLEFCELAKRELGLTLTPVDVLEDIKALPITTEDVLYRVVAILDMNDLPTDGVSVKEIGRIAADIFRDKFGRAPDTVPDTRFNKVNAYRKEHFDIVLQAAKDFLTTKQ